MMKKILKIVLLLSAICPSFGENIDIEALAEKELLENKKERIDLKDLEERSLDELVEIEEKKLKEKTLVKEDRSIVKRIIQENDRSPAIEKDQKPIKEVKEEPMEEIKEEPQKEKSSRKGPEAIAKKENIIEDKLEKDLETEQIKAAEVDDQVEEVLRKLSGVEALKTEDPMKELNKSNPYAEEDKIIELVPTF